MDRILPLRNPIRDYAWGSRTALAEFEGRPPSGGPEAELWIGAHPSAPSRVVTEAGEMPLDRFIAADPERVLGPGVVARFGPTLPFLMKVLAAEAPLSLQAHPDAAQAREGFARENAEGLAADAPERCYRDPNAKLELICALGEFEALCGFRRVPEIRADLEALEAPALEAGLAALRGQPGQTGLAALFRTVMELDAEAHRRLVDEVVERVAAAAAASDPRLSWVVRLAELYPGDVGVLAPLLLNHVVLSPGEALFLDAGRLHAYLGGTGVELMGNSDNVLRGGLTPKHVDVPELLGALVFEAGGAETLRAGADGGYATPAREFALRVLEVSPASPRRLPPARGVLILLCTQGRGELIDAGGSRQAVEPGSAWLVPAALGYELRARDPGLVVYRASVPPD